jgi:N-acetylmuramoyl-L-alanine amidase
MSIEEHQMYTTKFYRGDYPERQRAANTDKAICYVEHHFNAGPETANYTCAVVATNASTTSKRWASFYCDAVAKQFGIKNNGVLLGGDGGRGNGNISQTAMPAILVEPFFVSNPSGALWAKTRQDELAKILALSIRTFFPGGGLVAFSVGHKYKNSRPMDRGAAVLGGGNEADLAEQVLLKASSLLTPRATS